MYMCYQVIVVHATRQINQACYLCILIQSQVKFMILPDMLKNSPAFGKVQTMKKKSAEKGAMSKPFKGKKKAQ